MQVFGLPRQLIRAGCVASRIAAKPSSSAAAIRRDIVERWQGLRKRGLSAADAARGVGVSRATLYRWTKRLEPRSRRPRQMRRPMLTPALAKAVERLRVDNPMWGGADQGPRPAKLGGVGSGGKRKLAALLRREGVATSTSTVGRILRKLMATGVVTPVPTLRRRPGGRRIRFTAAQRYAKRLPKGLKPTRPGEIVQIDTLSVNVTPDRAIKHFTAYDPIAKWTVGRVATSASSQSAKALLGKLCAEAPFLITGIQVDGGSEFMAEFEQACAEKRLSLFVLPPKRPQLNGAVERNQGAWRYEFYACHELPARLDKLQPLVDAFAHRFNHYRPHQPSSRHSNMLRMLEPLAPSALGDLTPAEYLQTISGGHPASHMS